jgi:hypothetical protein
VLKANTSETNNPLDEECVCALGNKNQDHHIAFIVPIQLN